jgi:hypothetical protein
MDFWHTNIFGGIWASIFVFINWILIFVTGKFHSKIKIMLFLLNLFQYVVQQLFEHRHVRLFGIL